MKAKVLIRASNQVLSRLMALEAADIDDVIGIPDRKKSNMSAEVNPDKPCLPNDIHIIERIAPIAVRNRRYFELQVI